MHLKIWIRSKSYFYLITDRTAGKEIYKVSRFILEEECINVKHFYTHIETSSHEVQDLMN